MGATAGNKIHGQNLNQTSLHHHITPRTPPPSPQIPPNPETPPKTSKITIPNWIHGPKQGDLCQNPHNTQTSLPILINQAPDPFPIPSYPEAYPKRKKCTSLNRSHRLNQGNPGQKVQVNSSTPSSQIKQSSTSTQNPPDPETPP